MVTPNLPPKGYWELDLSRTASYEITLICLSVHASLSFLMTGSLVFSGIVHVGSWPWYLVTNKSDFWREKKLSLTGQNQAQNEVFHHFLEFGPLVYLEIACNYSLQKCLKSSKYKTHKKFWNPNLVKDKPNKSHAIVFLDIAYDV